MVAGKRFLTNQLSEADVDVSNVCKRSDLQMICNQSASKSMEPDALCVSIPLATLSLPHMNRWAWYETCASTILEKIAPSLELLGNDSFVMNLTDIGRARRKAFTLHGSCSIDQLISHVQRNSGSSSGVKLATPGILQLLPQGGMNLVIWATLRLTSSLSLPKG